MSDEISKQFENLSVDPNTQTQQKTTEGSMTDDTHQNQTSDSTNPNTATATSSTPASSRRNEEGDFWRGMTRREFKDHVADAASVSSTGGLTVVTGPIAGVQKMKPKPKTRRRTSGFAGSAGGGSKEDRAGDAKTED
ncbi:hypothetical protein B9479_005617 [Cryptococcus floricola]|uniref:Uncharacterized protein n=1 Tax=Cryptococcus floricola TaxID=2591691 RepID=A0A5D3AQD6_9TREE|nr:hypothetical protein B9479_005617 [Cryptococcus floricola]